MNMLVMFCEQINADNSIEKAPSCDIVLKTVQSSDMKIVGHSPSLHYNYVNNVTMRITKQRPNELVLLR